MNRVGLRPYSPLNSFSASGNVNQVNVGRTLLSAALTFLDARLTETHVLRGQRYWQPNACKCRRRSAASFTPARVAESNNTRA